MKTFLWELIWRIGLIVAMVLLGIGLARWALG